MKAREFLRLASLANSFGKFQATEKPVSKQNKTTKGQKVLTKPDIVSSLNIYINAKLCLYAHKYYKVIQASNSSHYNRKIRTIKEIFLSKYIKVYYISSCNILIKPKHLPYSLGWLKLNHQQHKELVRVQSKGTLQNQWIKVSLPLSNKIKILANDDLGTLLLSA